MKISQLAVFAALSALSSTAFASGISSIIRTNNEIGLAATGTLINYQEHISAGPSDTESGAVPGLLVKYASMGNLITRHGFLEIKATADHGNIHYDGFAFSTRSDVLIPSQTTDHSTMFRVTGKLGKGFALGKRFLLTPYLDLGYQYWHRHLLGAYGYTEDYSAALAGVGVKGQMAVTNRLVLDASAEFLSVIDGRMTPYNTPGEPDLGTANFAISGEEEVGLEADYRLSGHTHLFGGLSYNHYHYTGGNLNSANAIRLGFYEPSSAMNQFQVFAGVAYSF